MVGDLRRRVWVYPGGAAGLFSFSSASHSPTADLLFVSNIRSVGLSVGRPIVFFCGSRFRRDLLRR